MRRYRLYFICMSYCDDLFCLSKQCRALLNAAFVSSPFAKEPIVMFLAFKGLSTCMETNVGSYKLAYSAFS